MEQSFFKRRETRTHTCSLGASAAWAVHAHTRQERSWPRTRERIGKQKRRKPQFQRACERCAFAQWQAECLFEDSRKQDVEGFIIKRHVLGGLADKCALR